MTNAPLMDRADTAPPEAAKQARLEENDAGKSSRRHRPSPVDHSWAFVSTLEVRGEPGAIHRYPGYFRVARRGFDPEVTSYRSVLPESPGVYRREGGHISVNRRWHAREIMRQGEDRECFQSSVTYDVGRFSTDTLRVI